MKNRNTHIRIIWFFLTDRINVLLALVGALLYLAFLGIPIALKGYMDSMAWLTVWAVSLNGLHLAIKFGSLRLANFRTDHIRKSFVAQLIYADVAENEQIGASSRIGLSSSALDQISAAGAAVYGPLITGSLVMVMLLSLAFKFAGWIALAFIPIALAVWAVNQISVKRTRKNFDAHHTVGRTMNAEIQNITGNDIYYRLTGLFAMRAERLYGQMKSYGNNVVRIRTQQQASTIINQSLVVLAFLLLANSFKSGLSVGQVLLWTILTLEVRKHLLALLQTVGIIFQGGLAYGRIEPHLHAVIAPKPQTDNPPLQWNSFGWTALEYRYPNSEKVHRFPSAAIAKGSRTWIKGRNGAGKTTLWKLICGIYTPSAGAVTFDDSASNVHYSSMRIGIVTEPVMVLPGVLWNFLGSERMDKTTVTHAVDILGFAPFIQEIEGDYDHDLGMEHKRLSKGQTKVIMFLQAVISAPELLVLDEPFASVDAQWMQKMTETLTALPKETTVLFISHQPANLHFDSEIVL